MKSAVKAWFENEYDLTISGDVDDVQLYLVNTSGSVVKSKSSAKDGEEYKFRVENKNVKEIVEEM